MPDDDMEYKMVIVVRKDLRLSPGKMAVQVAHAAVNCAIQSMKKRPEWFEKWYDEGQKKVVVKVENLSELYEIKGTAEAIGLITSLVVDAGLTELPPGTTTCLGIGPAPEETLDKVTGHLGLV
ncbi:MAG: peptidyl-tRNA hydrolase Pth2 [Methanomassiliicoccales archaeon]